MIKKPLLFLLPLIHYFHLIPQEKLVKKRKETPQKKYSNFLENNDFYAFYPEDITHKETSITRSQPSLY